MLSQGKIGRLGLGKGLVFYWTGTRVYNYVMTSPAITFEHVNSIYVMQDPDFEWCEKCLKRQLQY